jgi:hypothetical protein
VQKNVLRDRLRSPGGPSPQPSPRTREEGAERQRGE